MLLMMPVHLIMSGQSAASTPFVITSQDGDIWPLFANRKSVDAFIKLSRREGRLHHNLTILKLETAANLSRFMNSHRPATVQEVWTDGQLVKTNVQFPTRLPVEEFLQELAKQVAQESQAEKN